MHSLNPFLRAFFRSTFPSQCNPVSQHILLVPTTEVILTHKDRDSGSPLIDLVSTDEFLASHVLRVGDAGPQEGNKDSGGVRDSRGKAKQFTTINGRTVVIKESFVYSNKGFRNLNQAQLLSDVLYYSDSLEAQQWLIYYISKPLIGALEAIKITPAVLPDIYASVKSPAKPQTITRNGGETAFIATSPSKKDIKSFNDLLNNFPMIARQMQPGLEKVFKEFNKDIGKPLPAVNPKSPFTTPTRRSSASSRTEASTSIRSKYSNGHAKSSSAATVKTYADDEEDHMRRTLENAVTGAIDLFQLVDKQQLSLLGATTELTGPLVERLIERYVTEQFHDAILFPRLSNVHKLEDLELESCIRHMMHIDIAQVGIEIEDGRVGKEQLTRTLGLGVEEFRKLGVAGSPQEMMDILLATLKIITGSSAKDEGDKDTIHAASDTSEKQHRAMTMNADTLVSLLLVVVIRSQVRHLQARLAYMRGFIFIDDVESGEIGYALSTFEAVLSYLAHDSGGLRAASRRNRRLWQATKNGNLLEMKSILEPQDESFSSGESSEEPSEGLEDVVNLATNGTIQRRDCLSQFQPNGTTLHESDIEIRDEDKDLLGELNLTHVFPFQINHGSERPVDRPVDRPVERSVERPGAVKRVSMDLRSLSNASEYSFHSRTSTVTSRTSAIEGDTSIEKLCQTQDSKGDSVLMMAVETRQPEALDYLLSLEEYYPRDVVLAECNSDDATLLSAAVQSAHEGLITIMVNYLFRMLDRKGIMHYLARSDNRGRTAAHYLFNAPQLTQDFGTLLPWRQKDKNGQTPLLALCRSYDHSRYLDMVSTALQLATEEQGDGEPLHQDNHIDSKGNTLLHVVSDPYLALRILQHCDADPNAPNDKRFTPMMVASKFGRFDLVRTLFLDKRVDIQAKEYRGMTAVELAKDDEVRNRIDDMILVSYPPASDGRVTAVVRSFFVEDSTIRMIIKSAARSGDGMIAVTTCRRSLADFENLAKWLSVEHPASWLPSISNFRSPFQIPSRPSRAVLHDIQVRLDKFLRIMLAHSTFSTHELLWEFILVPEIQPEMMAERSLKKADIRAEKVKEEYGPVEDVRTVEQFVSHARDSIRGVNHSTKSVTRRVSSIRNVSNDLSTALHLTTSAFSNLPFLPSTHLAAFTTYALALIPTASDPYSIMHSTLTALTTTTQALLVALGRPPQLIASLTAAQKTIDRHRSSLRRSDRWPLGLALLDDTRKGLQADAEQRLEKAQEDKRSIACELRYTQVTVAGEVAGWEEGHAKMARGAIKELVRGMVVREKCRLEGMRRAMRKLRDAD